MNKVFEFVKKITPSRRKVIQLYAALLYNAQLKGFITGEIFKGESKGVCLPGMNCYSCPGAIGACPLGSLQNALSESKTRTPIYVLGIILLYCIMFGRTICGWLCPAGLLQELMYKIRTPKLKKNKITRILSYFKYILLVVLVIALPLAYGLQYNSMPVPGFCKYICPVGTFEGAIFLLSNKANANYFDMLGPLFTWKMAVLVVIIISSIFIYRVFCRFLCPLGALYGIFNRISVFGIKVDESKCTSCNSCINHCKMDVKKVGDHECISCGECKKVCSVNAISFKVISKLIEEERNEEVKNDVILENDSKTINKKLSRRTIFTITYSIIMVALLVFALISSNISKKGIYAKNSIVENTICYNNTQSKTNLIDYSEPTLIYFTEQYNKEEVDKLYQDVIVSNNLANTKLCVVISYEYRDSVISETHEHAELFYDSVNKTALAEFTINLAYPYYVFIDNTNKLLVSNDEISASDNKTMHIFGSGETIGNKVGEICINKELAIVNKEPGMTFSVYDAPDKVIVLNFWGTWCMPCIKELPYFDKIQKEYSDDVMVVAINDSQDDKQILMDEFVNDRFKDYTLYIASDTPDSKDSNRTNRIDYFSALGGTDSWPMTLIIDKTGTITFKMIGPLSYDKLKEEVEAVI